jgi:hypothetical protein
MARCPGAKISLLESISALDTQVFEVFNACDGGGFGAYRR